MAAVPSQSKRMQLIAGLAMAVLVLATLGTAVYGIALIQGQSLSVGLLVVTGSGVLLALGVLLYVLQAIAQKQANTLYRTYSVLLEAIDEVHRQSEHTHTIAENSSLSDWAKQIVYREKDREYLGDQIRGAFVRTDWEAAQHMIDELEEKLGYTEDAGVFRKELVQAQQSTQAEKITAAIKRFDEQCETERWKQAAKELQNLIQQYPDNAEIRALPQALETRKQEFKRSLFKAYDEAVRREDPNAAYDILKKLDTYLTPNEASALKDSARSMLRARLMMMGERFHIAVDDKRFEQAIGIGQEIIDEYPNSGIAREIDELLPTLRQRAKG